MGACLWQKSCSPSHKIPPRTALQHGSAVVKRRSCSQEAHYWHCRSYALSSPNQWKNFLHPVALLYSPVPLVKEGKSKSTHRTAGRVRTEIKSFIYHHLFAPPSPFNPRWESYEILRISFESVMTHKGVWKHLGTENLPCEMVWNLCVWYFLGRVLVSHVFPFPRKGWAQPRAE